VGVTPPSRRLVRRLPAGGIIENAGKNFSAYSPALPGCVATVSMLHRAEVYDRCVAEDLLSVLTKFHREVVLPDVERVVKAPLEARISGLRAEMLSHFDAIYKRFDRLESEYQASSKNSTRWRFDPSFSN
jgi:hypothetical protein